MICAVVMMLGVSVNAWGTTTSGPVILPAGSTTYNSKDWRKHYAPCAYTSDEVEKTICISNNNGYNIKFYHAADYGNEGLQLERAKDSYIEMTINSSNGVNVTIGYKSNGASFKVELTGASDVTASSSTSFTTTTIQTFTKSATLKINGNDDNVVYISYIQISAKSSGTITIDCDDCDLTAHVDFVPAEIEYETDDDYGYLYFNGDETDIRITGVNTPDNIEIYYDVFDVKKGGVATDDCYFAIYDYDGGNNHVHIGNGITTFNEDIYIYYMASSAGTYTGTVKAYYEDANGDPVYLDGEMPITLKYGSCTEPTVAFSYNSDLYKEVGAAEYRRSATAKVGGSSTGQTIEYSSSNTSVATVDSDGDVTIKAVGSTTITATAQANATYCEGTDSYTLYVYTTPTVNTTHFAGDGRTPTSATFKGCQVSDKGGLAITNYGWVVGTSSSVDWSTKTTYAGHSGDVSLDTDFGSATTVGALTPGTTYYIRGFAYNGRAFGYTTFGTFTTPYSITLDKNGGSSDGSAYLLPNGTSLTNISEPTKTGYIIEGYYTTSGVSTKIATDEGALQASVTVSSTDWTNGSSQWVKGSTATFYAKWSPKECTITLDKGTYGTTDGEATVSYEATALTSITHATKTGYKLTGYYTAKSEGTKVLNDDGTFASSTVSEYITSSKWSKDATSCTLYAQWEIDDFKLTVGEPSNVTITATPAGESAMAEGAYADIEYNTEITLAYSSVASGYYWGGWKVTKDADGSDVTEDCMYDASTMIMPGYDVAVTAVVYPRANLVTRCPSVEFEVTGDNAWLTSYAGVEVYTDIATNQITIQCDDWGSANRIYVSYLDGEGTTITKTSSLFRLCDASTFNYMDASNDYFAVSGTDHEDGVKYAISYKPGASEYDQIDTWTLRLTAANGTTPLDYQDITIHGRALPEKFVIAAKIDGVWKALPADIRTTSGTMDKAPYPISVNDADAPTTAYYAPKAALYSGAARPTGAVNKNRGGIRLHTETEDGSDGYLQGGRSNSSASLWRTSYGCTTGMQSWYLRSTTFGDYKINVDPTIYVSSGSGEGDDGEGSTSTLLDRKLCVDAGKIGWYKTSADDFRILKVTNEVDLREATVYEWGEHGVVLNADMTDVASVTAHIENGTPSAATVTAVNAASLTAGKYVKVDAGALTIGAIANEKKVLNLHWKNSGGTEIGVSSIVIPRVIASSGTMSTLDATKGNWNTEVHVLPGQTLTADGGSFGSSTVVVKQLIVYPGATVNVSTGTLTATTLRLRNGWTRAGSTQYNTARVYIADDAALTKTTASMDYDIYNSAEGRHYYPLAVPFQTAVSTIDYADATLATASVYNKHFVIKEYNGARRATNGEDRENNWTVVSGSGNLDPCKGYIITAVAVKGEAIIRVPLTYNDGWTADGELATYSATTKNVIAVTAHTGTAASAHNRHKGWNMLGVPFMSCYGNVDDIYSGGGSAALINGELVVNTSADENMEYQSTTIPYVSVPSHNFAEYIQTDISEAELRPGWSFLVQVNTSGNLTFAVGNQQTGDAGQVYAPRRMTEEDVVVKTGIVLSDAESSDKTTFLISSQYSGAEYEIGADLEKMFGTGYTLAVYSLSNDTRLAYNAMSPTDAQQAIPLGFRAPADGEYTFSLNPKYADAPLERVDLIDYQLGTLTNLLTSSYTFQTGQTQNDTRFALNIVKQKETPTDVETVTGDGLPVNGVYKVLINEQLYIIQGDKMYDATGKRVKGINK